MSTASNEKKPTAASSSSKGEAARPGASGAATAGLGGSSGSPAAAVGNSGKKPGAEENFGFPANFGRAGVDFPIYSPDNIPSTSFSCDGKVKGG